MMLTTAIEACMFVRIQNTGVPLQQNARGRNHQALARMVGSCGGLVSETCGVGPVPLGGVCQFMLEGLNSCRMCGFVPE
jgi:hypothetical protein